MIYAINSGGKKITATPKVEAACPVCDERVIPKCGEVVAWHFAHQAGNDCDTWTDTETDWHRTWKATFKPEYVEVTITQGDEKHRADVRTGDGTVIEFQHSHLSTTEIGEREKFYGPGMIWLWDAREAFDADRLNVRWNSGRGEICWSRPRVSMLSCTCKCYIDCGTSIIAVDEFSDEPYRDLDWSARRARGSTEQTVVGWGRTINKELFISEIGANPYRMPKANPGMLPWAEVL